MFWLFFLVFGNPSIGNRDDDTCCTESLSSSVFHHHHACRLVFLDSSETDNSTYIAHTGNFAEVFTPDVSSLPASSKRTSKLRHRCQYHIPREYETYLHFHQLSSIQVHGDSRDNASHHDSPDFSHNTVCIHVLFKISSQFNSVSSVYAITQKNKLFPCFSALVLALQWAIALYTMTQSSRSMDHLAPLLSQDPLPPTLQEIDTYQGVYLNSCLNLSDTDKMSLAVCLFIIPLDV